MSAESAFPMYVTGNVLPFLPPYNLYTFIMTINICQESLTHEYVVKAAVNYVRQITVMPIMSLPSIYSTQNPIYVP